MAELAGKFAIITGGLTEIGKYLAILFAKHGADILLIDKSETQLKLICKSNEKKISYFASDITKDENIKKIIEYVKEKYGKIDILVNNSNFCFSQSLIELRMVDYDKMFNITVRTLVNMTIECLPLIIKSKGNILNVSNMGIITNSPKYSMYLGAKAAIDNFTKCWALDLKEDNVRVNSIGFKLIEGIKFSYEEKEKDKVDINECIGEMALSLVNNNSTITGENAYIEKFLEIE